MTTIRLLAVLLSAVTVGCASLKLPEYEIAETELVEITAKCGAESLDDHASQFCWAGSRAAAIEKEFGELRRNNHRVQLGLQASLVGLAIAGGAGALAEIHSSSLGGIAFLSGASTAALSYTQPASKFELYTDAYVRTQCLSRLSQTYWEPVDWWETNRDNVFALDVSLLQLRAQRSNTDSGTDPEAAAVLDALIESVSVAIGLRDSADSVFMKLPTRLEGAVSDVQLYADNGLRSRTGSYEEFVTKIREEGKKLGDAEESQQTINELDQEVGALIGQGPALIAFNQAPAQSRVTARDVGRYAPLILEADTTLTACIAGI